MEKGLTIVIKATSFKERKAFSHISHSPSHSLNSSFAHYAFIPSEDIPSYRISPTTLLLTELSPPSSEYLKEHIITYNPSKDPREAGTLRNLSTVSNSPTFLSYLFCCCLFATCFYQRLRSRRSEKFPIEAENNVESLIIDLYE